MSNLPVSCALRYIHNCHQCQWMMENGIPVSYLAYFGESIMSPNLFKSNHVIALSLQRSLITKNRFQMKKLTCLLETSVQIKRSQIGLQGQNGPICLSNNNFWRADKFATFQQATKNTGHKKYWHTSLNHCCQQQQHNINVPDWNSEIQARNQLILAYF